MNLFAFFTAASVHFGLAVVALNKQQVTGVVGAVHMGVTRRATLMALGDHLIRNAFCTSFVKDKILPDKFIFKTCLLYTSDAADE